MSEPANQQGSKPFRHSTSQPARANQRAGQTAVQPAIQPVNKPLSQRAKDEAITSASQKPKACQLANKRASHQRASKQAIHIASQIGSGPASQSKCQESRELFSQLMFSPVCSILMNFEKKRKKSFWSNNILKIRDFIKKFFGLNYDFHRKKLPL